MTKKLYAQLTPVPVFEHPLEQLAVAGCKPEEHPLRHFSDQEKAAFSEWVGEVPEYVDLIQGISNQFLLLATKPPAEEEDPEFFKKLKYGFFGDVYTGVPYGDTEAILAGIPFSNRGRWVVTPSGIKGVRERKTVGLADKLGVFVSSLCLIHCFLFPILVVVAPSIGTHFLDEDYTHRILYGVVALAALSAAIPGYRVHKHLLPFTFFVAGIALMGSSFWAHDVIGHEAETPLAIVGSVLLIVGHLINHKKCKTCTHHHD